MTDTTKRTDSTPGFDTAAAATRSMLGWGVIAGPIYLLAGLVTAETREGFNLSEHQLSLLMLGDRGWIQQTNLILSGVMCAVAAVGFHRAMNRDAPHTRWAPLLVAAFALGLMGSGTFAPDPMAGFPPGSASGVTASGLLHLGFGVFQFTSLTAACVVTGRWLARRGDTRWSRYSSGTAIVILGGFVGGAALAQSSVGVALLWLAVVAGYAWLTAASVYLWQTVPHPDAHRRPSPGTDPRPADASLRRTR